MKESSKKIMEQLYLRRPDLLPVRESIDRACAAVLDVYRGGGKLLVCGNGGSCADGGHIVGELMKGFLLKRPLEQQTKDRLKQEFGNDGAFLAEKLQRGLPAISLNAHAALISAFANDADPALVYAQQVLGYARPGDAVLGISTSGNAANVVYALMAAKTAGAVAIALTGKTGGRLAKLADCCVVAPHKETYQIQEDHLSVYHMICAFVESELFDE
ncbi:D-sedoheptulose-7-phosphate isomerase [Caproicibacter fermentans]|uniref:SIS domain-containing protein n=1 Tax=Caproicibacter fermentans TaxID=2576756 RepID=A0A7G8T8W0_9FIRM|nr:SIS domain-containing protein [Caproicibacter fermentans]QNK40051.1 SIS domain-containing protein [Caproicibacter fermentans]